MKIFSAAQIRSCDAETIRKSGISSIDLMERAAYRCFLWIKEHLPAGSLFVVLCGHGNNGGDGLALARMLHQSGYGVKAFLLQMEGDLSPDCSQNLRRLQHIDMDLAGIVAKGTFITEIPENITIIDAIFGTGLNRSITGWLADFINKINALPNRTIAIDMPSGLQADALPATDATIIHADDTLSFQFHKRSFFHPESAPFVGNIHILDINLDSGYIEDTPTQFFLTDDAVAAELYKPRTAFGHKGTFGHVLLAGGQYGKMGAMVLAARAALRTGAGLVSVLAPDCGYDILQTAVPEAMYLPGGETELHHLQHWEAKHTMGIGPGMGTSVATAEAFVAFIQAYDKPLVIDADALNLLAQKPELLGKIPRNSVLTPHLGEFARLFGQHTNSLVQVDSARIQAMRYGINIVLKGHHTAVVTAEGDCYYNTTGNAGMATGGSGDVLTGIITSLIAQGYEPQNAAILGVYLHGMAGDIAAENLSEEALIASDIIDNIGEAYFKLRDL